MSPAEFDTYSANYEEALRQGIAVSGEDSSYFVDGRLNWLAFRLSALECQPQAVLDYGCGVGNSLPRIREVLGAKSVAGVDISAESIAVARRRFAGQEFELSTLAQWPSDHRFDMAFCNGVFHHIPMSERLECARSIYNHLRPRGWLAFFENNPLNLGTRYVMSRIPFDRDAVTLTPWTARRLLRDAGFRILKTDYLFYFPRPLAFLRWTEPWLCGLPLGAQYMLLCQRD